MKHRCSTLPRWPGLALVGALAAAGSLAVVGAQQPPAPSGQKPAPAGQTPAPPTPPRTPGCSRRTRRAGGPACRHTAGADPRDRAGGRQLRGRQARPVAGRIRRDDGCVDTSLGHMAFSVDQDKTKSRPTCSCWRTA